MFEKPTFEIPESVRDLAGRNVDQVRDAYSQLLDVMRKTQDLLTRSQGAMAENALAMQARALRFAEENTYANFDFARDLARARTVGEYLDIQSRFTQHQIEVYARQAEELGRMMAAAAEKAAPKM